MTGRCGSSPRTSAATTSASCRATLGRLGFDCGRVDGIFGTRTARALEDFQRNCGLDVDGVCGPVTVRALDINGAQTGTGPGVAAFRELERLGARRRLAAGSARRHRPVRRAQLARAVRRPPPPRRAAPTSCRVDELDPSLQAAAANRYAAAVYLGFEADSAPPGDGVLLRRPQGFESAGGRSLALQLVDSLSATGVLGAVTVAGMRLPVLRETRMTAVVCSLGPVQRVTDSCRRGRRRHRRPRSARWALSPILMT